MKVRAIEVGAGRSGPHVFVLLNQTSGPAQDWSQMGHFTVLWVSKAFAQSYDLVGLTIVSSESGYPMVR